MYPFLVLHLPTLRFTYGVIVTEKVSFKEDNHTILTMLNNITDINKSIDMLTRKVLVLDNHALGMHI